ncbi:transglycosylase SLT domain-containing protein [Arenibaculum pallidiluteum]|uniref:transglycosylase SLT domain-containing protein n=1 Tax=Arenibaculum pallidiluteum TaxID=2812559 RepID=UPI001A970DAD|nr:transglycosylase SLT domain-containing protein [Arenibaculum pallidiluteum]
MAAALALVAGGRAHASPVDCVVLAREAERLHGIPPGILQAIALVESGLGGVAWPWTLNVGGRPFYMNSKSDAVVLARAAVDRFGTDVAVGCMQVHLRWHGERFPDHAELINPVTNVRYAAAFLISLRRSHGSWGEAVRHYHGSEPVAQAGYLCRVLQRRVQLGYQEPNEAMMDLCGKGRD